MNYEETILNYYYGKVSTFQGQSILQTSVLSTCTEHNSLKIDLMKRRYTGKRSLAVAIRLMLEWA